MTVTSASVAELWSLETLGIRDPTDVKTRKEREIEVQNHFEQTVKRNSGGRYSVNIPWIDGRMEISTNRDVAFRRLESTTRKLNSLGKFEDYSAIFQAWEEEGIISRVETEIEKRPGRIHYLPHRAVLKPESKTTPVRPVFDASCKVGRTPSLNDCLEKGPNLLELIPSILMRFRMGRIGVTSDIRKAFLIIELNEEDRDSVRFLWWDDPMKKSLTEFRHNRVVFGMNYSPFLLGAVMNRHLDRAEPQHPELVPKLKSSLYVDNCVLPLNTGEEYGRFKTVATELMAGAQMELRQWEHTGDQTAERMTSVLGLKWDKSDDALLCVSVPIEMPVKITKRIILSQLHQIFDPLGFLSPVLLIPKLLLQEA
jgi:hypothetical protein